MQRSQGPHPKSRVTPAGAMSAKLKHIPIRTCVGCGRKTAKGDVIRVVRLPSGKMEVDPTGRKPGRGSYLCSALQCWEVALKKGRLQRALRGTLASEDRASLLKYAQGLTTAAAQKETHGIEVPGDQ